MDRLHSWSDNYVKSTNKLNVKNTVKQVCDLEINCTLNRDNTDIESGIEVSGHGELSNLAGQVRTPRINRKRHGNVNKEEGANVNKMNEKSEKPNENVNYRNRTLRRLMQVKQSTVLTLILVTSTHSTWMLTSAKC